MEELARKQKSSRNSAFHSNRARHSVNECCGKHFYRKGNVVESLERSGAIS